MKLAYGALSVILVIYLTQLGLTDAQAGLLLTLTLIGDTAVSLWLTTRADRFGRRRTLVIGAVLMALAGIVFASTKNVFALVVAGTVGVISPSGHEVGPFLSIEQATLSHVVTDRERTQVFAWYTLTGAVATALGSWTAGLISQSAHSSALAVQSARHVVWMYAGLGLILMGLFTQLSGSVEASRRADALPRSQDLLGISYSRPAVLKACSTICLGFVRQRIRGPELRRVLVPPPV